MEKSFTLDTPIKRGEQTITAITLRKPNAGALRGVSLRGLLDFQPEDIMRVLPRVSIPTLTDAECQAMDPADLLQAGSIVAGFLLPKEALARAEMDQSAVAPTSDSQTA